MRERNKTNGSNYQKQLDAIIENMTDKKRLLLHSCCAPCSSYVLEYLFPYFDIWAYYYNPNITQRGEYDKRVGELKRLIDTMNRQRGWDIHLVEGPYEPECFLKAAKDLENCPEGGERCRRCFALRLSKSASYAAENSFDYFTTTLTISPLKNADMLNEIGNLMGEKYGVLFLPSDFKKKNGYQRSIELSKEYRLYRQDYCGCEYSRKAREEQKCASDERTGRREAVSEMEGSDVQMR